LRPAAGVSVAGVCGLSAVVVMPSPSRETPRADRSAGTSE
jgi:hypothetical protein